MNLFSVFPDVLFSLDSCNKSFDFGTRRKQITTILTILADDHDQPVHMYLFTFPTGRYFSILTIANSE